MKLFRKAVVCHVWHCKIIRDGSIYPEIVTVEAETKRTARAALAVRLGLNTRFKILEIISEDKQ